MTKLMWDFEDLREAFPQVCVGSYWVAARPLNYTRAYLSIGQRLIRAWLVFTCKADAFKWPGGQ